MSNQQIAEQCRERERRLIMSADDAIANLRAENNMLKGVLASHSDMREVIGQIRTARDWLADGAHSLALKRLNEVLRRLDESQE